MCYLLTLHYKYDKFLFLLYDWQKSANGSFWFFFNGFFITTLSNKSTISN